MGVGSEVISLFQPPIILCYNVQHWLTTSLTTNIAPMWQGETSQDLPQSLRDKMGRSTDLKADTARLQRAVAAANILL